MLKYGNTGLASWEKDYHTKEMLAQSRRVIYGLNVYFFFFFYKAWG